MIDVSSARAQFPALHVRRDGRTPIFLDGPGGTQVPQRVIDAMVRYLSTCNANHGGVFATSRESDAVLHGAHEAVADLLNAPSPDEVVFGANMTSLTFQLSRALARTLRPGDEVVVTRLDHDANITPWVLAARDAGAAVRWVDVRPEDCTLDLDDLRRQLGPRTRLVAVGCASNAVGTVNDVPAITRLAHAVGALVFLDAVHYAPHGPMDVQEWGCDFLACSTYKFFGPHVGILWGRRALLGEWPAYKVRPAPEALPGRWMTGTQNHEGLAGVTAAVDYLADLAPPTPGSPARRDRLRVAMSSVRAYEADLARRLLAGLAERPQFKVWGITDPDRLAGRVPTVSVTHARLLAAEMAERLAARQVYAWHGNLYALELSERLGVEGSGGLLRLGLVHYNTAAEVDAVLRVLDEW
jgi:cysteine desulfurase family protein (TIGR01976 family)